MNGVVESLAGLLAEHGLPELVHKVELRSTERGRADVRLHLPGEDLGARLRQVLLKDVARLPGILSVDARPGLAALRLSDDYIADRGLAHQRGSITVDVLTRHETRHHLVGYLGPNTTKPLHLGHLRNITVGHALAAALTAAGIPTSRYSLVGDIGRNVAEAMAGYELFFSGEAQAGGPVKPDHFVGGCYEAYLDFAGRGVANSDAVGDPCGREHVPSSDAADGILGRWVEGEPATLALWARLRALVEDGHRQTLRRINVEVDRCWYESDHFDLARALVERGLAEGVLQRADDGRVVFRGPQEFRNIVFARSDGFPTEHARVVAVFHRIFVEDAHALVHLDWNGREWEPAQRALKRFMGLMCLIPPNVAHVPLIHGMVSVDGAELSSSGGQPALIDELLDRLVDHPSVAALAQAPQGGLDREAAAEIVVKCFFLFARTARPLEYSWDRLVDAERNPGWLVARALCEAGTEVVPAVPERPAYRRAVMLAEALPLKLAKAVERLDLGPLTSHAAKTAEFICQTNDPSARGTARAALRMAIRCLGIGGPSTTRPLRQQPDLETS